MISKFLYDATCKQKFSRLSDVSDLKKNNHFIFQLEFISIINNHMIQTVKERAIGCFLSQSTKDSEILTFENTIDLKITLRVPIQSPYVM